MGSNSSKLQKLTELELREFSDQSKLAFEQVQDLFAFFKSISASEKDDGVIDYQEFCKCLNVEDSIAAEGIFNSFDLNSDHVLNFREFVLGVGNLHNANQEFQIRFSFSLLDSERKNCVTEDRLVDFIESAVQKFEALKITRPVIQKMVQKEFDKYDKQKQKEETIAKFKQQIGSEDLSKQRVISLDKPVDKQEAKVINFEAEEDTEEQKDQNKNKPGQKIIESKHESPEKQAIFKKVSTGSADRKDSFGSFDDSTSRKIDYLAYRNIMINNNSFFKWMQIDLENLRNGAKQLLAQKKK